MCWCRRWACGAPTQWHAVWLQVLTSRDPANTIVSCAQPQSRAVLREWHQHRRAEIRAAPSEAAGHTERRRSGPRDGYCRCGRARRAARDDPARHRLDTGPQSGGGQQCVGESEWGARRSDGRLRVPRVRCCAPAASRSCPGPKSPDPGRTQRRGWRVLRGFFNRTAKAMFWISRT